jgi:glucuronate isomerase
MPEELILHEDRFFDSDPAVRDVARELYLEVKGLPIVCPHGHVDPRILAENEPFPDPAELILIPDHYIFRMLYSQGVSLEELGIPLREGPAVEVADGRAVEVADGGAVEVDRRKVWQIFADRTHLFAGTPTGLWLNHVLAELFGIDVKLDGGTAQEIYDGLDKKLKTPAFLPRALFDSFGIDVLTTTDGAADTLEFHRAIAESGWKGRVIPCFRPDALLQIEAEDWPARIDGLARAAGMEIGRYAGFIRALEERRRYFRTHGAVSTDHAVEIPFTEELSAREAEAIFGRALKGAATTEDATRFTAHMLIEFARMSVDDGLVMQIHAGSLRNHNRAVFDRFGPDRGCDIPVRTEFTRNLRALLDRFGNNRALTLILFTLDESTYSRELAPLAGHYPAVRLGPPWWFHDSIEGMTRFRRAMTETAGIWNTVGFNDDTRAFPSIPARHDLARRVDSNFLAGLVTRRVIDKPDAKRIGKALARDLAIEAYRLG